MICLIEDEDEKSPTKRVDGGGHSGPGNDLPDVSIDLSDSGKSNTLRFICRLSNEQYVLSDDDEMEGKLSPYESEGEDPLSTRVVSNVAEDSTFDEDDFKAEI